MREYQSNHTGEQVDRAIAKVLQNVGKGNINTPVFIDADGDIHPIDKLLNIEEGSEGLVTSSGIHNAIVESEELTDTKIANSEARTEEKIEVTKSELNEKMSEVEGTLGIVNQTLTNRMNNLEENKQDKLIAGEGIEITEDNVINNTRVSAEWGNIVGTLNNQADLKGILDEIKDTADEAKSIAEGRAVARVFDTKAALDQWIADESHVAELHVGDVFYIRDVSSPDYWWDGTQILEMKTQKVDLTDYATKNYVIEITDGKQNIINDLVEIRMGASRGATALQSVPSEYVTETELSEYHDDTKQDKLEVIQLYKD